MFSKRKLPNVVRYIPIEENGEQGILREVPDQLPSGKKRVEISPKFHPKADVVLYHGDCRTFLSSIPDGEIALIVTSPPYNIGKAYERRRKLDEYLSFQEEVISECVRILADGGSICWQVGNYVDKNEILPLDIALYPRFKQFGLKLRNRIIWHFEHGLHCSRRFSGRYETTIWFTKGDRYKFYLDPVRIPQKYPRKKHFKGPKAGQLSCNPLGKNPGDLWIIPNVKHNHVEKTSHPCQFPVELIERLVLALTDPGDWVLDPFVGVGTSLVASLLHGRRSAGAEIVEDYVELAKERVKAASLGKLRTRPMDRPIYDPIARKAGPPQLIRSDLQQALFHD
jgi:adenine-specific DNA-methyltransferase